MTDSEFNDRAPSTTSDATSCLAALFLTVSGAIAIFPATAHEGATGIVKERMDMMKGMGDSMKTMTDMLKGKATFDHQAIAMMAEEMQAHAEQMSNLFPDTEESRDGHKSYAKEEIWKRWDDFEKTGKQLAVASDKLVEVAGESDQRAIKKQIVVTAKTCKTCHTDFRKPKE